jgi:hypothetical protein
MPTRSLPPPTTAPRHASTASHRQAPRRPRVGRFVRIVALGLGLGLVLVAATAVPAAAQTGEATLGGIIDRLRLLILGLASGLAALLLTIAGIRILFAADDPAQVEKGKRGLRSVAVGYGIALLAVSLVSILNYLVGG